MNLIGIEIRKRFMNFWTSRRVIIEPYWNWNTFVRTIMRNIRVIIEPYWNWNIVTSVSGSVVPYVIIEPYWNWNCYALYQGSTKVDVIIEPYWNWNRGGRIPRHFLFTVIIEPYWNWNFLSSRSLSFFTGYNWTLLELKCAWKLSARYGNAGYNWTLLELKFVLWISFRVLLLL